MASAPCDACGIMFMDNEHLRTRARYCGTLQARSVHWYRPCAFCLKDDGRWTKGRLYVRRLAFGVITLLLFAGSALHAQNPAIDDLKGKIFDAHMAQQMFAGGLKYCNELDGKSFYYQVRNRLLNLEEYAHSMENLVKAQVFNPAKKRPWTLEDAKERWEEVKRQAQEDKQKCELVRSLPELEKRLEELQQRAAASDKSDKKE
jgi:hypothetical protein